VCFEVAEAWWHRSSNWVLLRGDERRLSLIAWAATAMRTTLTHEKDCSDATESEGGGYLEVLFGTASPNCSSFTPKSSSC
jgi:hypothetical protein